MRTQESLNKQAALYGEPLGTRFARVLRAYRISQSRLASVIGISAPMLSQLASGQRVKISNPAVYGRLLRLEQLADTAEVASGDPAALRRALEEVAALNPRLTLDMRASQPGDAGVGGPVNGSGNPLPPDRNAMISALARVADADELEVAAAAVPDTMLAAALSAAARVRRAHRH